MIYTAPDGREVQGWLLYPPDFDSTRTYPLAVHIQGGPHVMWGPGFRSMWHEWQTMAARGYVVFFCNPRGSEGYGERWRDAIHANWGVADAPDILAGIDAVIARGGVDPARIGVTGGSYGGYMTAWLIAHSDRFACALHQAVAVERTGCDCQPVGLAHLSRRQDFIAHGLPIRIRLFVPVKHCPVSGSKQTASRRDGVRPILSQTGAADRRVPAKCAICLIIVQTFEAAMCRLQPALPQPKQRMTRMCIPARRGIGIARNRFSWAEIGTVRA